MRRVAGLVFLAAVLAGCGPGGTTPVAGDPPSSAADTSPPLDWLHSMTAVYREAGAANIAEELNSNRDVIRIRAAYRKRFNDDRPFDDRSVDRIVDWLVTEQNVPADLASQMGIAEVARRLEKGR